VTLALAIAGALLAPAYIAVRFGMDCRSGGPCRGPRAIDYVVLVGYGAWWLL